jgi:hypothetical protein
MSLCTFLTSSIQPCQSVLFAANALVSGAAAVKRTADAASTIASFFNGTPKVILTLREDRESFANGGFRVNDIEMTVGRETDDWLSLSRERHGTGRRMHVPIGAAPCYG